MILWFREGLLHDIEGFDPRCAKSAPSAYGDFAKSGYLPERKHKILVKVSNSSPSYLVLPLNDCLIAWRTSVFELQVQQIESGISLADIGA